MQNSVDEKPFEEADGTKDRRAVIAVSPYGPKQWCCRDRRNEKTATRSKQPTKTSEIGKEKMPNHCNAKRMSSISSVGL